jgi:hypothetical protein
VSLAQNSSELQQISFKGIITMSKPVQFKSSVKEGSPVSYLTFLFDREEMSADLGSVHIIWEKVKVILSGN